MEKKNKCLVCWMRLIKIQRPKKLPGPLRRIIKEANFVYNDQFDMPITIRMVNWLAWPGTSRWLIFRWPCKTNLKRIITSIGYVIFWSGQRKRHILLYHIRKADAKVVLKATDGLNWSSFRKVKKHNNENKFWCVVNKPRSRVSLRAGFCICHSC